MQMSSSLPTIVKAWRGLVGVDTAVMRLFGEAPDRRPIRRAGRVDYSNRLRRRITQHSALTKKEMTRAMVNPHRLCSMPLTRFMP